MHWTMRIFAALKGLVARKRIADLGSAREFLETRSAYLVQKSIMEYTQARANMMFSALLSEPMFLAAYERSRWLSYPASFSMVAEMVEGYVREEAHSVPGALDAGLLAIGSKVFGSFPPPPEEGRDFWTQAHDRLRRDLAQAALGEPKAARNIPAARAREVFDSLPVHEAIKRHDFAMFRNTLRFHLTEIPGRARGAQRAGSTGRGAQGPGRWTRQRCFPITRLASGRSGSSFHAIGAQVAQLVEQRTENPRVGGSIPPLGTTHSPNNSKPLKRNKLFSSNRVSCSWYRSGTNRLSLCRDFQPQKSAHQAVHSADKTSACSSTVCVAFSCLSGG